MYSNLDIVFLGGLFPKETEADIFKNSKGANQSAANKLQWQIIKGLDANLDQPIRIINSLYIGAFPARYNKMIIDTYKFAHAFNQSSDMNVGFLNLPGIKHFSKYFSLKPYLTNWALSKSDKKKVIIAYAMTATFTKLLRYVKKMDDTIITCLIVPDLPQYMNLSAKRRQIYKALKNIEINCIRSDMEYIDCYVLLTEYMRHALYLSVPYVVIEGMVEPDMQNVPNQLKNKHDEKIVLYAGALHEKYGVKKLIEAFSKIGMHDIRLWLYGSGEMVDEIIRFEKLDHRISYFGVVPNALVVREQLKATLLANPRPSVEEFTKYSFPSKNMEYMASGTPVLTTPLPGMPKEYYDYVYLFEDESVAGMAKTLEHVLSLPKEELHAKGAAAKEFVLREKNNIVQAKRIVEMLREVGKK